MKTIQPEPFNVYKFSELTEDQKSKAVEKLYDINVDHDWWDCTYEDAKNIGLEITGFDIDRGACIDAEFLLCAHEVAANIIRDHGGACETYKIASAFLEEHEPVFGEYTDETSEHYETREQEDRLMDIEYEFFYAIKEEYLSMLRQEYEYLTSEEVIIETIEANDYDFTANGEIY